MIRQWGGGVRGGGKGVQVVLSMINYYVNSLDILRPILIHKLQSKLYAEKE